MQAAEGAACEARDSAECAAAAGRLASHAELAKLEETMGQLVTRLLPQGLILGGALQCARRSAAVAQPVASRPPLKSQTTPATKAGGKAGKKQKQRAPAHRFTLERALPAWPRRGHALPSIAATEPQLAQLIASCCVRTAYPDDATIGFLRHAEIN